jgi:hypothetical protein
MDQTIIGGQTRYVIYRHIIGGGLNLKDLAFGSNLAKNKKNKNKTRK